MFFVATAVANVEVAVVVGGDKHNVDVDDNKAVRIEVQR